MFLSSSIDLLRVEITKVLMSIDLVFASDMRRCINVFFWMCVVVRKQEKELLEVLELPGDCGAAQNTKSRSSPLDSILKAITSTSPSSNSCLTNTPAVKDGTTEPLSAEASVVLSRLPDLSFMHSKVLMFPVSDCAN